MGLGVRAAVGVAVGAVLAGAAVGVEPEPQATSPARGARVATRTIHLLRVTFFMLISCATGGWQSRGGDSRSGSLSLTACTRVLTLRRGEQHEKAPELMTQGLGIGCQSAAAVITEADGARVGGIRLTGRASPRAPSSMSTSAVARPSPRVAPLTT